MSQLINWFKSHSLGLKKNSRYLRELKSDSENTPASLIKTPSLEYTQLSGIPYVEELNVPKGCHFFLKTHCTCKTCMQNIPNGRTKRERKYVRRSSDCERLVTFALIEKLPRRPKIKRDENYVSVLSRVIPSPTKVSDIFSSPGLSVDDSSAQNRSSSICRNAIKKGSADWNAEVILIMSSLGTCRLQYFETARIEHLFNCKGVEFFKLDMNEDNGLGILDIYIIAHLKKRHKLFLDPLKTSKKNIKFPQIIIDGVPIGSLEEIRALEDDNDLDYILAQEICPNCLYPRKNSSYPVSVQSNSTVASQKDKSTKVNFCKQCGAEFMELITLDLVPVQHINQFIGRNMLNLENLSERGLSDQP